MREKAGQADGQEQRSATRTSQEDMDFGDSLLEQVMQSPLPLRRPEAGERLGGKNGRRFEVLESLGEGAMGIVYRARDEELQRVVALKFLLPSTGAPRKEMSTLLNQEARAIAQLNHENIVRIFDAADWSGESWQPRVPFLVMEYLEGEPLSALLARGRPTLRRAMEIIEGVVAGLAHAHGQGVIHRDLKPSN
ncbi:MAG TPA: serine/threonine-protein kinase, partial [Myxococcaceae bacterium]|nr:serine/threonine-protein kinase [Myxococcaceae bacterium]